MTFITFTDVCSVKQTTFLNKGALQEEVKQINISVDIPPLEKVLGELKLFFLTGQ